MQQNEMVQIDLKETGDEHEDKRCGVMKKVIFV